MGNLPGDDWGDFVPKGLLPNQFCAIHDFPDDLLTLIVYFRIPSLVVSMDVIPLLLGFW